MVVIVLHASKWIYFISYQSKNYFYFISVQEKNRLYHKSNQEKNQNMCSVVYLVCGMFHMILFLRTNGSGFLWVISLTLTPQFELKLQPDLIDHKWQQHEDVWVTSQTPPWLFRTGFLKSLNSHLIFNCWGSVEKFEPFSSECINIQCGSEIAS